MLSASDFLTLLVLAVIFFAVVGFFARQPKPYTNKVMQTKRDDFLRNRK